MIVCNMKSLLCPLCIQSNHANCVGILSLENVIQTAKTSVLLESLDKNLKDIKMNIKMVVKDRKQNLTEIQKPKQKFHHEIKQVRNKLNEHLDTLEQKGLKYLKQKFKIRKYLYNLLFDGGSLRKMDINCKIEDKITDVLTNVASLDGYLLYCEHGRGIQKVNMSDYCSSILVKDKTLSQWSNVPTFKGKIVYTNNSQHTVTCCSLAGEKIMGIQRSITSSSFSARDICR
ncbi:unnamed protein product [Mytilus coruscus]|uniref:Uncharacterized protein n=1 Tax=Mytilus coruscus TaxID=42192 RepID=A0A6J8ENQ3_MYTCO|nr:unnamed protein product [Mytilus coruscus]